MVRRTRPTSRLRPHLLDAPAQKLPIVLAAAADALEPRFRVHAVSALLLEDLASSLGQRLDRAVTGRRHERGQEAFDYYTETKSVVFGSQS